MCPLPFCGRHVHRGASLCTFRPRFGNDRLRGHCPPSRSAVWRPGKTEQEADSSGFLLSCMLDMQMGTIYTGTITCNDLIGSYYAHLGAYYRHGAEGRRVATSAARDDASSAGVVGQPVLRNPFQLACSCCMYLEAYFTVSGLREGYTCGFNAQCCTPCIPWRCFAYSRRASPLHYFS